MLMAYSAHISSYTVHKIDVLKNHQGHIFLKDTQWMGKFSLDNLF